MTKEKAHPDLSSMEATTGDHSLVLFNDDVNTFEFVISSLVEVCDHDEIRAEQCALIAHFNGKCGVLSGEYGFLKERWEAMRSRGLSAEIER